jgi:2,4-dienoyl-CoA reductase-like NADH-dependent reductase (Old Yellow Enzyme family)
MRRYNRGDFDLVAVGRSILQDPEWVLKVKENRFNEIEAFSPASLGQLY